KKLGLRGVDLIGSHGQTVCHLPPRSGHSEPRTAVRGPSGGAELPPVKNGSREGIPERLGARRDSRTSGSGNAETGTMQIGDATIIAAAIGAPVVSQFRQADMAVGGQGAPLVPWTDYVLFRDAKKSRVIQNIGGIANLTYLPAGGSEDDVIAFDCGPGNMIIDALVSHFTRGRKTYDRDGRIAAHGRLIPDVYEYMLAHPYLRRPPPKSCGREEFGSAHVRSLLARFAPRRYKAEHWIATATHFTAECLARAYAAISPGGASGYSPGRKPGVSTRRAIQPRRGERITRAKKPILVLNEHRSTRASAGQARGIDEIILCGGGAKNPTLLRELARALDRPEIPGDHELTLMDEYGISTQAKECVSFAMLAVACVDGVPANLPRVTGANCMVLLGHVNYCEAATQKTNPLR
ncbi:MAG TPA: anhydro-N-acetylmuramic acid kinase, partial [Phycisphaerae bacterium]|nr:anhydro-N-acetylmuramic acid kinase [Phycisphaerae bacterium]